ncbi:MAG: cysteine desulfurase [Dethiobacter sp.]|nr:cysteine desulfurase [Dethiobacter sp.]
MRKTVYLDNSATTRVLPEVAAVMRGALEDTFGNPSSLHRLGLEAERLQQAARRVLAATCGAREEEIFFTSGGTEANNLALKGAARRRVRRGRHLVTTKVEHASVLQACRALAAEGFTVTFLEVDSRGLVDPEQVAAALRPDTILISVMHVNNEVGAIQPVAEIGRLLKAKNSELLFHVDAVQSLGKLPVCPVGWRADLVSFSAHKIHGPKGVGALYCREGLELEPLFHGGGQEKAVRPGTENVPGIAGLAAAVRLAAEHREENIRTITALRQRLLNGLLTELPGAVCNGSSDAAPYIASVTFPAVKGEVLLHALEERGIYVSTGSACHSRRPEPSHVLLAMGMPEKAIASTLRFSLSAENTVEEIDYTLEQLVEVLAYLRRF